MILALSASSRYQPHRRPVNACPTRADVWAAIRRVCTAFCHFHWPPVVVPRLLTPIVGTWASRANPTPCLPLVLLLCAFQLCFCVVAFSLTKGGWATYSLSMLEISFLLFFTSFAYSISLETGLQVCRGFHTLDGFTHHSGQWLS
jgi:hypothetical protein